jgi:uncharacterized protein (TIGR02466 family)
MHIIPLFPEIITINELNINSNEIFNFLEKEEFTISDPTLQSNGSEANFLISKDFLILNKFPKLKEQINLCIKEYFSIFNYDIKDHKIHASWATKTLKDGFSQKHSHSHSFLSGVYYPIGSEDFKIKFFKNKSFSFWDIKILNYNEYNSDNWTFKIGNNFLFLWHSPLGHQIIKNNSSLTRYSIAFDVIPQGVLNNGISKIEIK